MSPSPPQFHRGETEALVKASVWLGRRIELLNANLAADRATNLVNDLRAGSLEAAQLCAALDRLADKLEGKEPSP